MESAFDGFRMSATPRITARADDGRSPPLDARVVACRLTGRSEVMVVDGDRYRDPRHRA